jgi:hypothetical protein
MRMRMLMREVLDRVTGDYLFEVANVLPAESGLPYPIYIRNKRGIRHGASIKAYPAGYNNLAAEIVVTIEEDPRVLKVPRRPRVPVAHLEQLKAYVRLNHEVLLAYWHADNASTAAMLRSLRRLEGL